MAKKKGIYVSPKGHEGVGFFRRKHLTSYLPSNKAVGFSSSLEKNSAKKDAFKNAYRGHRRQSK